MAVTAQMVKELRERTGAGMMDCKKVLVETDGDMDKAIEVLREKGLAKAAKKAGRVAAEGIVRSAYSEDGKIAALIEVNSETDFVAKNEEFVQFVEKLAEKVLAENPADVDALLVLDFENEGTVQDALNNKIATIGENLSIRRFARYDDPEVVYTGYIHGNDKVGVIVGIKTDGTKEDIAVVGKDVAMQVAAMNPKFVNENGVDPAYIEEERKITEQQIINEEAEKVEEAKAKGKEVKAKNAELIAKMVSGKINKLLKEVCLVEQKFVKDGEKTVKQYVKEVAAAANKEMEVIHMRRFEVGEGIEKKEENFAEEVAKQLGK